MSDTAPRTVQGRLVRPGGDAAAGARIELLAPTSSVRQYSRAGADGDFRLPLEDGRAPVGPVVIRVRDTLGGSYDVALPQDSEGDVLVVLPEPPEDPREQVRQVVEMVEAQDEAAEQARVALADRAGARVSLENAGLDAVRKVLIAIGRRAGGDLRWRFDGTQPMDEMLVGTTEAGRTVLSDRPRTVVADEGVLEDGEQLPTRAFTARLAGEAPRRDGLWRADVVRQLRVRQEVQGPDGLPLPGGEPPGEPDDGRGGPTAQEVPAAIADKIDALVEAIRLPEDPPILGTGSAVDAPGAEVELARGIADATAFHDVHELALAMPDLWQEVFDSRLTAVVETAVRHAIAAGISLEPGEGVTEEPEELTLLRLVDGLRRLDMLYSTTSAHRLAPQFSALRAAPSALTKAVAGSGGVVFRQGERYPDDTGVPGGFFGGVGGGLGEVVADAADIAGEHYRPTPRDLLQELQSYLNGEHAFTVFAASGAQRAINYGVLLTWRQLWQPLSYQTGEIAHTMTLAPGEQRKVVTRRRRSLKRFTAEAEKASSGRSSESTDTGRAESEIVRKATATTNFQLTSQGSTKLLVADGSFTTSATRDVGREGSDTRRRFHEAVVKAAQEYREEHSMEVRTEAEEVLEEESTIELSNPNREVALTAVFYSLQRRYHVSEHLHRARPVIMVAMPVPDPSEITTAWIIRYAWILRRALLDPRKFTPTIDYLTTSYLGDKEILDNLKRAADQHEAALREAQHRLGAARLLMERRGAHLRELREALARGDTDLLDELIDRIPGADMVKDALDFAGGLFGGDDDDERKERAAKLVESAEEEFERAERESREAETQLAAASSAYQEAVRDLVRARAESRNNEVRIAELRVHISDNILPYMQAIWSTQPPDQRFFELQTVQVPVLSDEVRAVRTGAVATPGVGGAAREAFRVEFATDAGEIEFRPLVELCNLHQLIGFIGNLAIFELLEGNALTDLVLAPYLDRHEVLRDPDDPAASWTLATLQEYADRLRTEVAEGRMTQEEFDEQHAPFLRATLERLITEPRPTEDEVVIPSDSFYLELLTSGGSLLEPFQREHRAVDVERARGEQREGILESLRRAALILGDDLADPDMDRFERRLVAADIEARGVSNGDSPDG